MTQKVGIESPAGFDAAFGKLGLKVGPRTGPNKRSQDDTEWYVLRRFLKPAVLDGYFRCPLNIMKRESPDFELETEEFTAWVEITEATINSDQIEMTKVETSDSDTVLMGDCGGRFADGAAGNLPERVWAADIIRALRRKRTKAIFQSLRAHRHLVVYVNSNAGILVDELEAYSLLREVLAKHQSPLLRMTNGGAGHILGKEALFLDLLGFTRILKFGSA